MRQSRVVFYREEKREQKEGGRVGKMEGTSSVFGAEILSLRLACPQSVSKEGVI
jgi:hypothetical protein